MPRKAVAQRLYRPNDISMLGKRALIRYIFLPVIYRAA